MAPSSRSVPYPRHAEAALGAGASRGGRGETGERTAPECSRLYDDGAGRRVRCGGPMAPVRRPGMWSCGWCGKIELTTASAAA
jgi:hypothetical protein